jgi:hypothetical protein
MAMRAFVDQYAVSVFCALVVLPFFAAFLLPVDGESGPIVLLYVLAILPTGVAIALVALLDRPSPLASRTHC